MESGERERTINKHEMTISRRQIIRRKKRWVIDISWRWNTIRETRGRMRSVNMQKDINVGVCFSVVFGKVKAGFKVFSPFLGSAKDG